MAPGTGEVTTFASEGESGREMTGAARFVVGAVMEKFMEFDETAPLITVIATVPTNAVSAGVIVAVSSVALIKVVGRGDPFQSTTTLGAKLVPVTVSVRGEDEQFVVVVGEIDEMAGATIDADIALDSAPPVAGLDTVTGTVPTAAISGAVIAACTCVGLTNVVGRLRPFHCTPEQGTKPVPLTLKLKGADPAVTVEGEMDARVAAGIVDAELVKGCSFERTPKLDTSMFTATVEAMYANGTMALTCVELTNVVARVDGTVGGGAVAHSITEPFTKFVPVT